MKCFYHPDQDAVMTCSSCGKGLCKDCTVQKGANVYCQQCAVATQKGLDTTEGAVVVCGSLCLSPLVALIAWFIWRNDKPEKAKQAGYVCIAVGVFNLIMGILYFFIVAASM